MKQYISAKNILPVEGPVQTARSVRPQDISNAQPVRLLAIS
jgi:hypothetical protein